jgi:ABC-type uncharacterized transport system substrate-binding protein
MKQYWLFDDYYSAFITADIPSVGGRFTQPGLDAWMNDSLTNLAEYNYFTEVNAGGAKLVLASVSETTATVIDDRLSMSFYLSFATPIDPSSSEFTYSVFDPFYYIEMLHAEADDALTMRGAPGQCRVQIIEPNPNIEDIRRAYGLDARQRGTPDLGRNFAEKAVIAC